MCEPVRFSVWSSMCGNALFLKCKHSTDCSVLCHYRVIQNQFVRPSFNLLSDDYTNNVCLGVCLLVFGVQFECAYESGAYAFVHL